MPICIDDAGMHVLCLGGYSFVLNKSKVRAFIIEISNFWKVPTLSAVLIILLSFVVYLISNFPITKIKETAPSG